MSKTIRYHVCFLGLIAALMATAPVSAQERREVPEFRTYGQPASPEEGRIIDGLIQQYKDAWAAQDVEYYMALHAKDTEWINAYARMFQSDSALAEFIEYRLFPAFDSAKSKEEVANMRIISIRYIPGHAAIVHIYTDGSRGPSRNSEEPLRRTHLHVVLEKQSDDWKIVHTAIMDAR